LNIADGTLPQYLRGLYSATLKIDQHLGDRVNLTSISSYFHSYADVTVDVDKGPLPFLTAHQAFKNDVGSQEVRLANTGDGAFKWLVGVFAQANEPSVFTNTVAFTGDLASLELLMKHQADPSIRNTDGKTAVDIATERGHPDVARLLAPRR